MSLAIAKAKDGIRFGQTPFGACVVKGGEVVSCAHNGVWEGMDITAHAEMIALRLACKKLNTIDLSGCVIYSTCEPCPMCFSACHWARIDRIVYGATIRDAKKAGFNELPISNAQMRKAGRSGVRIMKRVLHKENIGLFSVWGKRKSKRAY